MANTETATETLNNSPPGITLSLAGGDTEDVSLNTFSASERCSSYVKG